MRHLLLLSLLLGTSALHAQQPPSAPGSPTPPPDERVQGSANGAYWRCRLPGGVFLTPLRAITSLSSHEFVVDGVARVTEVTVGTNGPAVARFYYLEPVEPTTPMGVGQSAITVLQERMKEGADRSGQSELWKKVVKNYPTTTHAHTIEFRLESKKDLMELYESVEEAWMRNRPTQFKRPMDGPDDLQ